MTRYDNFLLRMADALILYVWNQTKVRRIVVLRILMLFWVIGGLFGALLRGVEIRSGTFITLFVISLFMLSAFAIEEYQAARLSPKQQNAKTLVNRTGSFQRSARVVSLPFAMMTALVSWGSFDFIFSVAQQIAWFGYMILIYSLTPEDPPKKKEKKVRVSERGLTPVPVRY